MGIISIAFWIGKAFSTFGSCFSPQRFSMVRYIYEGISLLVCGTVLWWLYIAYPRNSYSVL